MLQQKRQRRITTLRTIKGHQFCLREQNHIHKVKQKQLQKHVKIPMHKVKQKQLQKHVQVRRGSNQNQQQHEIRYGSFSTGSTIYPFPYQQFYVGREFLPSTNNVRTYTHPLCIALTRTNVNLFK